MCKKIRVIVIVFVLVALLVFPGCDVYSMADFNYPSYMTHTYCKTEYRIVDYQLIPLSIYNSKISETFETYCYFAIKDLPVEHFLARDEVFWALEYDALTPETMVVVFRQVNENPIYDWEYASVELYKGDLLSGTREFTVQVDVPFFKDSFLNSLETENYIIGYPSGYYSSQREDLRIRIYFADYPNIAWDAKVWTIGNGYYVQCILRVGITSETLNIPLPAEIVALIPQ